MKISRERVRQIYFKALRKLKNFITSDWQTKYGKPEKKENEIFYSGDRNEWNNYINEKERKRQETFTRAFNQLLIGTHK